MRKLLVLLSLVATQAFAEASFDQIESLIEQKNYAAAEAGLEVIVKNHPNSAKAFYAMAQAQAGLGNLEKAQKALNIATGLNPTLDFAPEGSVQKLKQAITPQTAKIEAVHETSFLQYLLIITLIVGGVAGIYVLYMKKKEREDEAEAERLRKEASEKLAKDIEEAKKAKLSDIVAKPADTPKNTASIATTGPAVQQPLYTPQPTHTTVVNNTSSNDGLLTGILIGDMMNHHHDTTRVVEREVIREVPASRSSRDSSWDDTPSTSSSRSSSWDDDSSSRSSSRSSSWDDSSSSSSSSSWSSSSSSDSSSSWSDSSSSSSSSSDW